MDSLLDFVVHINSQIGISLPSGWQTLPSIRVAQLFVSGVNRYFFQTHSGIGTTEFQGEELQYFSEFHKFWESHHREILNATINTFKAHHVAMLLNEAIRLYGEQLLYVPDRTHGIGVKAIAQVRFLTANQDFREPPSDAYGKYLSNPYQFDANDVNAEPDKFLTFLGMTGLSQNDKRRDYARNAANLLLQHGITAYDLRSYCDNDARKIRDMLISAPNAGYGSKKANMFIRDMVELKVWEDLDYYDSIDVASDINTMKLSLRTGIISTDIPLVSSFLDMFCHQYGYIDNMSALAWRTVWEQWKTLPDSLAPKSPCMIDYLLYNIGRSYCRDNLVRYLCESGHSFYYFGARLGKCRVCRNRATPSVRFLPCQVSAMDLPRDDGELMLRSDNLFRLFDGKCIFEEACNPQGPDFKQLDPPKSISIKGQTGWTNAYADSERGGGGLMS